MRLIDGDALIEKAKYEAEGMEEPYSTDLPVIIDWLVGKMPTEHPEQEEFEWCRDCAEYDQIAHCCHRWTKVIRQTVAEMKETQPHWIPCSERFPEVNEDGESDYILLSFSNYSLQTIGRYQVDDQGGAFYDGDDDKPLVSYGLFVNAWMPLPEPYKEEGE